MLYEFDLSHNTVISTKNISWAEGEGSVDQSTVTRWFEKFRSGYKNLNYSVKIGRLKTVDSEAVFRAIETNPTSSREYQASSASHSSVWLVTFTT